MNREQIQAWVDSRFKPDFQKHSTLFNTQILVDFQDWLQSNSKCKICQGTEELREALQAWDIHGVLIPECPTCKGTGLINSSSPGIDE